MMIIRMYTVSLMFFFCGFVTMAGAEEVRVAVASNFLGTMNEIITNFEADTGHTVVVSPGSSGKLYAQIKHGAPFDVFFSADGKRPILLEEEGLTVKGSRFVYAVGRLTLWSPDSTMVHGDPKSVLSDGHFEHLAIANPKTAPYGRAAEQTLNKLGLWKDLKGRIVRGENIGQTFQFVFSKNAQIGFVALSQVLDQKINGGGSRWDVPPSFHDPLEQEAVLLLIGKENAAAKVFLDYVQGEKNRAIIEQFGYGVP
ncbi:MAG: molybdate ABC transporter substrate-binding protein [Nitrospirales bacterium]